MPIQHLETNCRVPVALSFKWRNTICYNWFCI